MPALIIMCVPVYDAVCQRFPEWHALLQECLSSDLFWGHSRELELTVSPKVAEAESKCVQI